MLFDELTVAENIFLGHAPRTAFRTIDWKTMNSRSKELLHSLESNIDPTIRLKDLSIAQRHLVAIARALSIEARIVIMDEPTAALSRKEIDDLFRIVESLKAKGKAILFISHKFDEVYEIADNFVVFRDGRAVGHGRLKETPQDEIVRMMVGRDVKDAFPKVAVAIGDTVLEVDKYCHRTEFRDISFKLRRGEILGVYGLIGAGRSELCQSLFGITKPASGRLTLEGKEIAIRSPLDAIRAGIVYVPEERGRHGLALPMPIYQNMSLPSLLRTSRKGFLRAANEFALARKYAERLDLRAAALSVPVGHPLGRKPAEGRDRQMAGDAAEGHHSRRADQGHRHRLEGRRPRLHQRTGGRRALHHHDLLGTAGDPGHVRPRTRHEGGPDGRSLRPGWANAGSAGARRHRQRLRNNECHAF